MYINNMLKVLLIWICSLRLLKQTKDAQNTCIFRCCWYYGSKAQKKMEKLSRSDAVFRVRNNKMLIEKKLLASELFLEHLRVQFKYVLWHCCKLFDFRKYSFFTRNEDKKLLQHCQKPNASWWRYCSLIPEFLQFSPSVR